MSPLPPPSMGATAFPGSRTLLQWPLLSWGGQNTEKRTSFPAVFCLPPNPWELHYAASPTLVHSKEPPVDAGTRSLVLRCLRHPDACNSLAGRPTPTFHQPLLGSSSDPRDLIPLILTFNNLLSVPAFFYPLLGYANLSDSGDVCYNPQEWGGGVPGAPQSPAPSPSLGWPPEAPSSHTSSAFLLCSLLLLSGSLGQVCHWCMCGGRLGGDLGEVRSRPGWLDSPVTRGPGEFPLLSLPGFRTRPPLSRKITPLFPACTPPVQGCPPNPADSTLGLGPRSAEVGGRAGDAEGTCLLPTPSTGSARQQGNWG